MLNSYYPPYCHSNEGHSFLPIIYVTNKCNFNCPYCFVHKKTDVREFFITLEELARRIDHLLTHDSHINTINLTGGEPTLHPHLLQLIDYIQARGIENVLVNTNISIISEDISLIEELQKRGVTLVISINKLPLNRFQEQFIEKATPINFTFAIVSILGQDTLDHLPSLYHYFRESDLITNLEIQPIVFCGMNTPHQENLASCKNKKIGAQEIKEALPAITNNTILPEHFISVGDTDSECYQICHCLKIADGRLIPIKTFADINKFKSFFNYSFILEFDQAFEDFMNDTIADLWSSGEGDEENEELHKLILQAIKRLTLDLFSHNLTLRERNAILARSIKVISIHSYMDCFTYDESRLHRCNRHLLLEGDKKVSVCHFANVINPSDQFIF